MGLQKQVVQVPLIGLDTHSDPKNAPPGSYELSENEFGRRTAGGGIEWRKRLGTTSRTKNILGGGTISNGRKLAKFYDEQLVITDTQLYAYDPQVDKYVAKGDLTPIGLKTTPVTDGIIFRQSPDSAVGGGYICTATATGTAVTVTVANLATGANVIQDQPLSISSGSSARVIAMDTSFIIFHDTDNGFFGLVAYQIFYATPGTVGAPVQVYAGDAFRYDVIKSGTSNHALVAVYPTGGGFIWTATKWTEGMAVAATFNVAEQGLCIGFLHHDYADGKAYVAYLDTVLGTRVVPITIATWVAGAVVAVDPAVTVFDSAITGYRLAGVNTLFAQIDNTGFGIPGNTLSKIVRSTGGAFSSWQLGAGVWSRVFKVSTSYYIAALFADGLQDKYFILNASGSSPKLVGQAFDGNGGTGRVFPANVPAISSTVVAVPVLRVRGVQENQTASPLDITGAAHLRLDFSPILGGPKQIGDTLLFPGAVVKKYDGQRTTEAAFPVFPSLYNATASNAAGTLAPGVYSLKACYVELDGRGRRHESAPSQAVSITVAAPNDTITVSYTNLRIGDKITTAFVELSVTLPNGDTWFAQQQVQSANVDGSTFTILNVAHLGDELYTTGRALPHNAYPPASLIEVWGNRAFLANTDAPNQLWVSDEIEEGSGLSFSQVNVISLPSDDGEVSTINEFDDRLIIGKVNGAIYPLSGSGPAANGDGQYQAPARINSVVGPIGPNGVIKTTNGLIFTSLHGRYLLPRGGADPVRLAKIEGYDSLTVTGASNVDGYEQTRLVTSEGRTLVYHYGLPDETGIGHWSTFTGQAAVDCGNFGGSWCYLSSDGTVHVEVAGQYADDGVAISRTSRFNWLTGGGTFGNIRLYAAELLGEVLASCTITATVAYDFDATIIDTRTEAVTVGTKGALELRPSRGRSTAVQFAISETSSGEGYRLTALAVEIGAKPGFAKKAAAAFLT